MEKGFYEVHKMKEYHAFKIVPHKLFDDGATISKTGEKIPTIGKRYTGRYPKHWHRSLELFYVLKTGCTFWCNGKTKVLKDDDLVIINSGEPHECYGFGKGEKAGCSIIISYDFLKEVFPEFDNWYFVVERKDESYHELTQKMMEMLGIYREKEEWKALQLRSVMYEILYILVNNFKVDKASIIDVKTQKYEERYKKILEYIKLNYREEITLRNTAEYFGLSQEHFSRSFKNYVGQTFTSYVKELRVDKAQELLLHTDLNIIDIAASVGEPDAKAFIRDFKRAYSVTPHQYRKMLKK